MCEHILNMFNSCLTAFSQLTLFILVTILHVYEAILLLLPECLASMLDYIVMQMRKINHLKGYWHIACMIVYNISQYSKV